MARQIAGETRRAAQFVDHFIDRFDFASLSQRQCSSALDELHQLRPDLAHIPEIFQKSLDRLEGALTTRLAATSTATRGDSNAMRRLRRLLHRLAPLALGSAALSPLPAAASSTAALMLSASLIGTLSVGDQVFNPTTGQNETVVDVSSDGSSVRTNQDHVILLAQAVGDTYTDDATGTTYTVTAVTTNSSGHVTSVTVSDGTSTATTSVVNDFSFTPPAAGGGNGTGYDNYTFATAAGDVNQFTDIRKGKNGGDGRDGAGVKVCIPYVGCHTEAVEPKPGGNGADGPDFSRTVTASNGNITTVSDGLAGAIAVSAGGDGGQGGDSYGNIAGAKGGKGGAGGDVTLTNRVDIVTSGAESAGIFVQSQAGKGGKGGKGYIAGSGGSGGTAGQGGTARGYNYGNVSTSGDGSVGMFVQSTGGSAGTGGSSYGIVGSSGDGSVGGNGGTAYAQNDGIIGTTGDYAHGVMAQSIGGNGGNSGKSGGIVAFGGDGGGAGDGGAATVKVTDGSETVTTGNYAHALFAQSIGGGGGSAKSSGGVVAFGGDGSSGGDGGSASVVADKGAYVETRGTGSYGIFAESVGGSGGTAGGSGGVFTLGGTGGTGSDGGSVSISSNASVRTSGRDARGIFGQSIGGGGGDANATGGLVALGGSGNVGGDGGSVTITQGADGSVITTGAGADGIFAQSTGGGGGTGANSGGLVALGGSGDAGGSGGAVSVTNSGYIGTTGNRARGIFAESLGGGGGAGGDAGGLVSIGGSGSVASPGGNVVIGNYGHIQTTGNVANAIEAQSIGGGGGDGGSTGGVFVNIGGSGGGGGKGGTVNVTHAGTISTQGNDSNGIFAQSTGGGGGNGGSVDSGSLFAGVQIGGSGGNGGNGGDAAVTFAQRTVTIGGVDTLVDPTITTDGDRARGVFLQSIGGGGGNGGYAANVTVGAFVSASIAIGGSGGGGGKGGAVTINDDVAISTTGDNSEGIFAQSVGGGGGAGGYSVATSVSGGVGFSGSFSLAIGGSGGSGGRGGAVNIDSGGVIATQGDFSTGLFAQSTGGGGGKGGYSLSVSLAASDAVAVSVPIGLGGSGGSGGDGGAVDTYFGGAITTTGNDAAGTVIQSVGGGGGTGGYNVSGAVALSGAVSAGVAIGVGGSGGSGGDGSTVTGKVGGAISTSGDRSAGAIIQSNGGGGGSGSFNVSGTLTGSGTVAGGIAIGIGGAGGGGGNGGIVSGTTDDIVTTTGFQSDGLVVQSNGGGGGSGAFNIAGNIALSGTAAGGLGIGVGGSGGDGGSGGTATATANGTITTAGDQSRGFFAQSLGGGGGAGAFNITGDVAMSGTGSGSVGVGVGGSGGGGGAAGSVTASAKSITTTGDQSAGFIAQSNGGGGGAGAFNITGSINFAGTGAGAVGVGVGGSGGDGGDSGAVGATIDGTVATQGDSATAILVQSQGGGGGIGAFNITGALDGAGTGAGSVNVGVGGSGGGGGAGSTASLTMAGAAGTMGADSDVIAAQSTGGGGGTGAFNIAGSIDLAGTGSGNLTVGVGGSGGGGGAGGAVSIKLNDGVTTNDTSRIAAVSEGDRSAGIIAQSTGGGGGNGAINIAGGIAFSGQFSGASAIGIGGSGGDGGDGGSVIADITGYTLTKGADSTAILAQSVGGGGGNGAFNIAGGIAGAKTGAGTFNVGIGGSGGSGGAGSTVDLTINDAIASPSTDLIAAQTNGDRAAAIVAQSTGGGGGNGSFSITGGISGASNFAGNMNIGAGGTGGGGGDAAAVTAAITGTTITRGAQSGAVLAQSTGGGGGNGGFNIAGGIALSKDLAGNIGIGFGGRGGGGGNAGAVTLNINQNTTDSDNALYAAATQGDQSYGVIVQSTGGGGGNGAFNITGGVSIAKTGSGNLGVGIGGSGGGGGNAGVIVVNVNGDIDTQGAQSSAFLAQSVGGGGGNGAFDITGGIAASKDLSGNIGIGIGGSGGSGGNAATVTATVTGDLSTDGDKSDGATIQSNGGGGGNGSFNITGGVAVSLGNSGSGTLGIGIGGFGDAGGSAGNVTGSITGAIETLGDQAHGALLQSEAGGGGAGGMNITGGITASRGTSGTIGFGLGGFGGNGGAAGTVTGTFNGDLHTAGEDSYGATLQSIGGAGGAGAFNVTGGIAFTTSKANAAIAASIGIGGFGGDGGDGAGVTGSITGQYVTTGLNSDAILAQSVGGGGGSGGFNISGGIALGAGTAGSGTIGVGGFGGAGGNASTVTLTRIGDTYTTAGKSDGIVAQSIGGGGGTGGYDVSGDIAFSSTGNAGTFGLGVGGFGGGGGNGGDITLGITGSVFASGIATTVATAETSYDVNGESLTIPKSITRKGGSNGVLAQSLGGGGGNGGFNISGALSSAATAGTTGRSLVLGVGGFGGSGGDAGTVNASIGAAAGATDRFQVQAAGDDKIAFGALSIGGAGGTGGFDIDGGISANGQVLFGVGGFGGSGGVGGAVTASVDADVFANGNYATGIVAQSIGGGGGVGGMNVSGGLEINFASSTDAAFIFGIGGFGGAGNRASDVSLTQNGQVLFEGIDGTAVLAQSIGGGGGAGGLNVTGTFSTAGGASRLNGFTFGFGMGGYGGTGADAGAVDVVSNGNILVNTTLTTDTTTDATVFDDDALGKRSPGLVVQSVGGGGGTGGMNVTGVIAPTGSPVSFGIGGTGGAGGDAGDVTVTRGYTDVNGVETATPGLIATSGDGSEGMLVQSIGGGGGNAGINAVFGFVQATDKSPSISAVVAIGGSGGDAGKGGDVTIRHAGDIRTSGEGSDAILAQSITKGGGSGNYNIGTGYFSKSSAISLALGGNGGDGGTAGNVSIDHDGTILTEGYGSSGIKAQSIGRGGGNASFDMANSPFAWNQLNMTWGGLGGSGGLGGTVTIKSTGYITTQGDDSDAIFAQSLGGAGGWSGARSGGVAFTTGTGDSATGYGFNISVGRQGGPGGVGGAVDVTNSAQIVTSGDRSRGIFAESLGGDGGTGGSAIGLVVNEKAGGSVSIGGVGGDGATANTVTVDNDALINTSGDQSDGILAHSIGGGGGAGGMSGTLGWILVAGGSDTVTNTLAVAIGGLGGTGGTSDTVSVANSGTIRTTGIESYGVRAQSIGGGGGVGGAVLNARLQGKYANNSIDVNIGGGGGTGEHGGGVDVTNTGLIYTKGVDAAGISANSIGGGGGDAGIVIDLTAGGTPTTTQHRLVVNIGGSGGSGGKGGTVSVANKPAVGAADGDMSGYIVTEGQGAYGIFAQSLGGGGGNSSNILSASVKAGSSDSLTAGFNFGSVGGDGNTGGAVSVTNAGLIQTSGEQAHGIFAQSLGGGGGNGGMVLAGNFLVTSPTAAPLVALGGVGGDGGDGGSVTVTNSGSILTTGARADGILAQSIGGGGGDSSMGFAATGEPVTMIASNAFSAILGATGGGTGGIGGDVTVTHTGDITVTGQGSQAIRAESINGGGGGLNLDFSGFTALTGFSFIGSNGPANTPDPLLAARAGADGASGMNAGKVSITTTGSITVGGDDSAGVSLSSIGGGGGDIDLDFTLIALDSYLGSDQAAVTTETALGSTDSSDSVGGDIGSDHSGTIVTTGARSAGVLIRSIGGGGGTLTLNIGSADADWYGGTTVLMGATDTTGSSGGDIDHVQDGTIITTGDYAPGALIQSIGGGGGSANITATIGGATTSAGTQQAAAAATAASTSWVVLGADGGSGNDGGAVSAAFSGGIYTTGEHAAGLVVQSIGAGGGVVSDSGDAAPVIYLGATNGANGSAGGIDLTLNGTLQTEGNGSTGAIIQSIGGGGGIVFGDFTAPALTLSDDNSGAGSAISVAQGGDLNLLGNDATGILAQSLGGGGGYVDGAFAGNAGGSGSSGAIVVTVDGTVTMAGSKSTGVFAQSIGTDSDAITIGLSGMLYGAGDNSVGIVAQSIGGSGGWDHGVFLGSGIGTAGAVDMVLGGSIGMSGSNATAILAQSIGRTGGDIGISLDGSLVLDGADSTGILAQSVGGSASFTAQTGLATANAGPASPAPAGTTPQTAAITGKVAIPESQTTAGTPSVEMPSVPTLAGAFSNGMQSVDIATFDVGESYREYSRASADASKPEATALPLGLRRQVVSAEPVSYLQSPLGQSTASVANATGSTGTGGAITLDLSGSIQLNGNASTGIVAQTIGTSGGDIDVTLGGSIGGTGANATGIVAQSIAGSGGFANGIADAATTSTGDGGSIAIDQSGSINMIGDGSTGILVQSLGDIGGAIAIDLGGEIIMPGDGTAGIVAQSNGIAQGGSIDIEIAGAVYTPGVDSTGVSAQSLGANGGGDIAVALHDDVRGGSGTGVAVSLDGGRDNLVTSTGTLSAPSGLAVTGTSGNDRIENYGLAVGNMDLGSGGNFVLNAAGANYITIDTLDLRDGSDSTGTFRNDGNLYLGLSANPYPIDLADGATFASHVSTDPATDLLLGTSVISQVALDGNFVQGGTGTMAFDVGFGPYASDRIDATGNATVDGTLDVRLTWLENAAPQTLIATGGSGIDNGLHVDDTIALDYRILANDTGIQLAFTSDFGQDFLTANGQALGHSMDSALQVGNAHGIGRLMALLGSLSAGQEGLYSSIFAELDPEPYLAPAVAQFYAASDFKDSLFACTPGPHGCLWADAGIYQFERAGANTPSLKQAGGDRMRFGGTFPLGDGFMISAAIGYDHLGQFVFDRDRATGHGEGTHWGAGLGKAFGPRDNGAITFGVIAGEQDADMLRRQTIFTAGTGHAAIKTDYLGIVASAGYRFDIGSFAIRPSVEASTIRMTMQGFTEKGLGGLGVNAQRSSQWVSSVTPRLQVGVGVADGVALSVSGGAKLRDTDQLLFPLRLNGMSIASDPARIGTHIDRETFTTGATLTLRPSDRTRVTLSYSGDFGKTTDSIQAGVAFKLSF